MKKDARLLTPDAQEDLRRRVVAAVTGGMKQSHAAETFGVARKTVWAWMVAWRESGDEALASRKRGPRGECGKLPGWQAATIFNMIRDRHPEQMKLPFVLWTSEAVRKLIKRKFDVELSARSVRRYLKDWGFTPQKPKRVAYERNPEAVTRWIAEDYPAIIARAKREKACVYWGDEMGMRSDHQAGRSYAPKGQTPTRPGTGKRFGANMISAITNRGVLAFMIFSCKFNADVFLQFARRLVKQTRRKVFLIVDGHPVHRSAKTRQWLEANADRIEMFFLPAYSPELNPDEMLNNDVKQNAIGRKSPRTRKAMLRTVRGYLNKRRKEPEQVRRYFHESSVRYAAV